MSRSGTKSDRIKQHAVSLYRPDDGAFAGGTYGDLWPQVVGSPAWVVDNNTDWEKAARAEPSNNFVLGRTMVLESDSLRGAVQRAQKDPLPNVFTLEMKDVRGQKWLAIDRLGATLGATFKGRIQTVENRTPDQTESINSTSVRETKRRVVLQHEQRDPGHLLAIMASEKRFAHRNYSRAGDVSLMAYAIRLGELRRGSDVTRVERFEQNHVNVFGDAEVIQDALFLGIGVFSNDADVIRMAELLGIQLRTN